MAGLKPSTVNGLMFTSHWTVTVTSPPAAGELPGGREARHHSLDAARGAPARGAQVGLGRLQRQLAGLCW